MPRFQVRRKKKKVEPIPEETPTETAPQKETEEAEMSTSDDEFVNEAMEALTMENKPQTQQKQVQFAAKPQPHFQNQSRFARSEYDNRKFLSNGPGQPVRRNPIYRETPTGFTQSRGLRGNQKPKIRYRSLYGPNGDQYDTRTQARILYASIFG